jgi:CBS domain-containing protein
MTADVRSVELSTDVADVARIFIHEHVRSVPVLENGRTVGILSRRDLLRGLVRPDESIRDDLLRLVEDYTGEPGSWDVVVSEGVAHIGRTDGVPQSSASVEEHALSELAAPSAASSASVSSRRSGPGSGAAPTAESRRDRPAPARPRRRREQARGHGRHRSRNGPPSPTPSRDVPGAWRPGRDRRGVGAPGHRPRCGELTRAARPTRLCGRGPRRPR